MSGDVVYRGNRFGYRDPGDMRRPMDTSNWADAWVVNGMEERRQGTRLSHYVTSGGYLVIATSQRLAAIVANDLRARGIEPRKRDPQRLLAFPGGAQFLKVDIPIEYSQPRGGKNKSAKGIKIT